jgi:Icc-related predicted phosphoesterase
MKILFTSDLHGHAAFYRHYARILRDKDYDLGVIAGDLGREFVVEGDAAATPEEKERELAGILRAAGKPVLVVPGNHDVTAWASAGTVANIHGRRVVVGGHAFVGYRHTTDDRGEEEQERDLDALASLVDGSTILVTHSPPYGILDRSFLGRHVGSRALRRLVGARSPLVHLFGHAHEAFGRAGSYYNGAFPRVRSFLRIEVGCR